MKTFKIFLVSIFTLLMTSCVGYTYAQDDTYYDNGISYSTIVTYGTPYYIDNIISYYLYNGIYYYPYFWQNHWYFHPYDRIQPHGFIFRPGPGFRPDNRFMRPDNFRPGRFGNSGMQGRPGNFRSSTRETVGNHRGNSSQPNGMQPRVNFGNRSFGNQGSSSRGTFSGGSQPRTGSSMGTRSSMGGSRMSSGSSMSGSRMSGGSAGGHMGGRR